MAKTMWEKAYEKIENCGEKYREAKARGDYAMARFWGNAMRGVRLSCRVFRSFHTLLLSWGREKLIGFAFVEYKSLKNESRGVWTGD